MRLAQFRPALKMNADLLALHAANRLRVVRQLRYSRVADWFLEQQIEGEPVSRNLADAMATLIRLPSAKRCGAKRVLGPDLRQAA